MYDEDPDKSSWLSGDDGETEVQRGRARDRRQAGIAYHTDR